MGPSARCGSSHFDNLLATREKIVKHFAYQLQESEQGECSNGSSRSSLKLGASTGSLRCGGSTSERAGGIRRRSE